VQIAETRLHAMASTDPLTGALNRRSLLGAAERLVAEGTPFSIVMGDVDHFKSVNDTHGHACGDHVLVQICQVLRDAVRPADEVARWGGEEFVVLLPKTPVSKAEVIAERARRSIGALAIAVGGDPPSALRTTMTFGVASLRPGESPESCIARADAALYRGEDAGRDRVTSAVD